MAIKISVAGLCLYYIWDQVDFSAFVASASVLKDPRLWVVLGFVFLLAPLNWYLEALKWRICLKPVSIMQPPEALNAVLRGLSLNWLLPFTIGDFIGRILGLPKNKKTILAMLLCRYVSLMVTCTFGLAGAAFMYLNQAMTILPLILIPGAYILTKRWLKDYSNNTLWKLLLATVSRFALFTMQFMAVGLLLVPEISFLDWLVGVPVVFLIRSLIPSMLGALGIREAATIWVFSPFTDSLALLTLTSMLIWVINIVIPSVYGLVPIFNYKVKMAK